MSARDAEIIRLATERGQLLERRAAFLREVDPRIEELDQQISELLKLPIDASEDDVKPVKIVTVPHPNSLAGRICGYLDANAARTFTTAEIAKALGIDQDSARVTLWRMSKDEEGRSRLVHRAETGKFQSLRGAKEQEAADLASPPATPPPSMFRKRATRRPSPGSEQKS